MVFKAVFSRIRLVVLIDYCPGTYFKRQVRLNAYVGRLTIPMK